VFILQLYLENFYPYIAKKFVGPHRRGWHSEVLSIVLHLQSNDYIS